MLNGSDAVILPWNAKPSRTGEAAGIWPDLSGVVDRKNHNQDLPPSCTTKWFPCLNDSSTACRSSGFSTLSSEFTAGVVGLRLTEKA